MHHNLCRGLRAEVQTFQIDVHHLVPDCFVQFILIAFIHQHPRDIDACVIDNGVELPKGIYGPLDHILHTLATGDVGVNINHVFRISFKYGRLRVHIAYCDLCAVGKQLFYDRFADSGCTSGHDD